MNLLAHRIFERSVIKHGREMYGRRRNAAPPINGRAKLLLRPESGAPAFTMIELLIAVAISAIVLATINTLFFGALHLREKVTAAAEQTMPVDHAIAMMKHDLQCIVPVGVLAGPMGSDAPGIGMTTPPLLEIYTGSAELSEDSPWGDMQKVDYTLRAPTNRTTFVGRDLVRGVTHNLLSTGTIVPDQQTLLQDVQNLQFSYYDGTNWNDTWSVSLSNIPVAIKVSIDFAVEKGNALSQPKVQFLVPIVTWSNTNSITNQVSN
jgi:prepilin-type N-terminal cleavage/methylation domain-containing protein